MPANTASVLTEDVQRPVCRLPGCNPETGNRKRHPLGWISSWLTSRGVDSREDNSVSQLAWCRVWCPKKRFTAKIWFKHLR